MKDSSSYLPTEAESQFIQDHGEIHNVYMDGIIIGCRRDGLTIEGALLRAISVPDNTEHQPFFRKAAAFLSKNKDFFKLS